MTTIQAIQLSSLYWSLFVSLLTIPPIVFGFTLVLVDANDRGQPGWLWALLTIPFGWLTILAYVVVRAVEARIGIQRERTTSRTGA